MLYINYDSDKELWEVKKNQTVLLYVECELEAVCALNDLVTGERYNESVQTIFERAKQNKRVGRF